MEFQKALLKQMSGVLKPETFSYSTPLNTMFKIQLQEPSADPNTFLESKFEHPLMTEMIDLALSVHPSDSGPAHIKLSLEWNEPDKYFSDMEDHFVEHESVSNEKKESTENSPLTLEQCLDHYTKAETLSAEDAWRCPSCREYLPVVKTLGLWSLPDILVIHFKRFRQQQLKGSHASKLTTMVNFPLNELDMLPWYLANSGQKSSSTSTSLNGTLSRKGNMKPTSKSGTLTKSFLPEDHRFDLYAVCYHQGDTLETGHYTAACKNPYDQQWYKFDDQRVSLIKNEDIPDAIINNEAYMLFYQRRKESENCDSSVASTSSSDHWVSKITANNTVIPSSSSVGVPLIKNPIKIAESENKVEEKDIQEASAVKEPPKLLPSEIIVEVDVEKKEIISILTDIADIKPIDSDDIPEVEETTPMIIAVKNDVVEKPLIIEHSIKEIVVEEKAVILTNGFHSENYCNGFEDKKDDENTVEKKIQVTVEISTCSPPPPEVDFESEINDIVHKDILRRENNSKSQDFKVSHHNKINSLLWNDQNNNNNRHSDIGGITISELLLMDRIDDISSTSLPKNYMLHNHDTERITNRIRSVSTCSKDTLMFIDQQSLIDDDSLMDNRSHWVSF